MLNIKVVTSSLAIWTAFTFVFCVAYGMVVSSSLHTVTVLEQILPGVHGSRTWALSWD